MNKFRSELINRESSSFRKAGTRYFKNLTSSQNNDKLQVSVVINLRSIQQQDGSLVVGIADNSGREGGGGVKNFLFSQVSFCLLLEALFSMLFLIKRKRTSKLCLSWKLAIHLFGNRKCIFLMCNFLPMNLVCTNSPTKQNISALKLKGQSCKSVNVNTTTKACHCA